MDCCLFGAEPKSEPMLVWRKCWHWEHFAVTFEFKYKRLFKNIDLKIRFAYFVSAPMYWYMHLCSLQVSSGQNVWSWWARFRQVIVYQNYIYSSFALLPTPSKTGRQNNGILYILLFLLIIDKHKHVSTSFWNDVYDLKWSIWGTY